MAYLWKYALRIADQQASLAAPSISDDNKLLAVLGRCRYVRLCARALCADGTVTASGAPPVRIVACEKGFAAVFALEMIVVLYS